MKALARAMWTALSIGALVLAGACSTGQEPAETTTPSSEAIIEVPAEREDEEGDHGPDSRGGQQEQHQDDSTLDTDMHDHGAGDLDDAPEAAEIELIEQVAADFWVANTELRHDHPDGLAQVLERIRPYVTDEYYDHRAELLEGSGREVWWVEWVHQERTLTASVRDATFRPDQPFAADLAHVWVEGASVDNSPRQNRQLGDAQSQFVMVELHRTDTGWKVASHAP